MVSILTLLGIAILSSVVAESLYFSAHFNVFVLKNASSKVKVIIITAKDCL